MKIKKGDNVIVIAGKDKGKTGKVVRALPEINKVIVEGVNVHKRHLKAKTNTKQGGGIVDITAPIHVSNVQIVDPKTGKGTRVGVTIDVNKNTRVRVTKKSGTILK
jgi:large subunit ribosomal protein L24